MANKQTKRLGNKGFSLVELIVVIAIMAVLVGVLAPQFIRYVEKSRESTDLQNLDSVKTVVENFYADKEGAALPGQVVISLGTTGLSVTDDISTNTATMLSDNGVANVTLKGSQWTGNAITATWDLSANSWTYTGTSNYYQPSATGDSIVAK